jgi:hypothetical protein
MVVPIEARYSFHYVLYAQRFERSLRKKNQEITVMQSDDDWLRVVRKIFSRHEREREAMAVRPPTGMRDTNWRGSASCGADPKPNRTPLRSQRKHFPTT